MSPLKTWNTKKDFDDAYSIGAEGHVGHPPARTEVRLHYNRSVMEGFIARRAQTLGIHFGPAAFNKRILVVGGGFGWLAQELRNEGFTKLVVTDTSPYIHSEKDNTEEADIREAISLAGLDPDSTVIGPGTRGSPADLLAFHSRGARSGSEEILDEDICTSAGRVAVRQSSLGGNPNIIVTEQVLESLTDAEAIALSDCAHAFPGQVSVAHLVETNAVDPEYNLKTLADWKLLIPADTFISVITFEVLL